MPAHNTNVRMRMRMRMRHNPPSGGLLGRFYRHNHTFCHLSYKHTCCRRAFLDDFVRSFRFSAPLFVLTTSLTSFGFSSSEALALVSQKKKKYDNPWPYTASTEKIGTKKFATFGPATPLTVTLGAKSGEFRFEPDNLKLTQGKLYALAMDNPSDVPHYFTALDLARSVYTVVVLAGEPPAEFKGQVTDLELKPGAQLVWYFGAMRPGTYDVRCPIKGHEAMAATVTISKPTL